MTLVEKMQLMVRMFRGVAKHQEIRENDLKDEKNVLNDPLDNETLRYLQSVVSK